MDNEFTSNEFIKLIERTTRKVMETKEIKVGDYIRGFKFYNESIHYSNLMDRHIGKIGLVEKVDDLSIDVLFYGNSFSWEYPKDQATKHLVKDPLEDTPFHKPDFSHLLDKINPSHYKRLPKETIERIQDNLTPEEFKGYLKGNILKYLDRYQDKNGVEDIKKADWYLNKLIETENGKA